MSGRDHETDHDGECFPGCRECRLEKADLEVSLLKKCLQSSRNYNSILEEKVSLLESLLDEAHKEIKNLEIDLACEKDGEGY